MKATTPQKNGRSVHKPNNTSLHAQRTRILDALIVAGAQGLTTIKIREELDCMAPAARILELREEGHDIRTVWAVTENAQGSKHRNARYVLLHQNTGVAA